MPGYKTAVMKGDITQHAFREIKQQQSGDFYYGNDAPDLAVLMAYATDASVYQEMPAAVALPRSKEDIVQLVRWAGRNNISLIPRAAGTSLAGQVVGNGVVVDVSRYMNQVLELNMQEKWVCVEPGLERDVLNEWLRPYGLFFGPETSTSNRAMIGGMIGNNSCGLHSMVWGATRDNLLSVEAVLANGEEVVFGELGDADLENRIGGGGKEAEIYRAIFSMLNDPGSRQAIVEGYPAANVKRRNSGYALDALLGMAPFGNGGMFNLSKLIAGSEGTLAFITTARLKLRELPPPVNGLVCVHCSSLEESLQVNLVALRHPVTASELVDDMIMGFTKDHPEHRQNRFFIQGDPAALLMVEFMCHSEEQLQEQVAAFIHDIVSAGLGYASPLLRGNDIAKAWNLRKAGLGLLRNIRSEAQPVNLIEDCAVAPEDLPAYIADLQELLRSMDLKASCYAHAGAGELHVEPLINLKSAEGRIIFRTLLARTAEIVKKYRGALSGEHGDGRLRGEFIGYMLGERCYELCREVKRIFDPAGLFNPGKIIDAPPLDTFFRYQAPVDDARRHTYFDFSREGGILQLAEKCSGSGDCRKTHLAGGTMCPSFMATRFEKDTTRARANLLRQFLARDSTPGAFDHEEILQTMDLCLSCKGCKAECPSSVDVAKMKAEFLQQYYDANGTPLKARMIAEFPLLNKWASAVPRLYNFAVRGSAGAWLKKMMQIAPQRDLPELGNSTLRAWYRRFRRDLPARQYTGRVYLFCDEFTNYNDVHIGQRCIELLTALGYEVILPHHVESGRTHLSKGLVKRAAALAGKNVEMLSFIAAGPYPVIGLEPSAILTFRDEYADLVPAALKPRARALAEKVMLLEEFMSAEMSAGRIRKEQFSMQERQVLIHGHCHQKALSSMDLVQQVLSFPANYKAAVIPSGCCGMAGSFGFDKEHYAVSMQIGELVLFPAVRRQAEDVIIAAAGTSCRHQILDGTGRRALHPAEVLFDALVK